MTDRTDWYDTDDICMAELVGWMTKDDLLRIMCDEQIRVFRDVISIPFIAESWGESEYHIKKHMKALKSEGLVKRDHMGGRNENGFPYCFHGWSLTDKGKKTKTYKECLDKAEEDMKKLEKWLGEPLF